MRLQADSTIRILEEPVGDPTLQFAAGQLRHYLGLALGVRTHAGAGGDGAYRFILRSLSDRAGRLLDTAPDAVDIVLDGTTARIQGATARATLFGVYAFLKRYVGCRWVRPGEDHTPRLEQLDLPDRDRQTLIPDFGYRALMLFPFYPDRSNAQIDWAAKVGLNTVHVATNGSDHWEAMDARTTVLPEIAKRGLDLHYGGHTFYAWVPPSRYFETHPEYFALVDGRRSVRCDPPHASSLCLSNPAVPDVAAQGIRDFLDRNPETRIVDLWSMDGFAYCQCASCQRELGEARPSVFSGADRPTRVTTEPVLRFANAVARQIADTHPDVWVNLLAYMNMLDAPRGVGVAENVLIGFAPVERLLKPHAEPPDRDYFSPLDDPDNAACRAYLDEIRQWRKLTDRFFMYDYYSGIKTARGMVTPETPAADVPGTLVNPEAGSLFPILGTICHDLRLYRELGIRGVSSESWDWDELNMYAYAEAARDSRVEPDALLAEFCQAAYAGAAEPMIAHWRTAMEGGWQWPKQREACLAFIDRALRTAIPPESRACLVELQRRWRRLG